MRISTTIKPLLLFLLALLLSFPALAQLEEGDRLKEFDKSVLKPRKVSVLKMAPIALLMGQIPIAAEARFLYELAVTPKQAYFAGISINFQNAITRPVWDSLNQQNGTDLVGRIGFRVQGGYKFYVIKAMDAPEGLFIGPHVSYNFLKVKHANPPPSTVVTSWDKARVVYFNANVYVGYQFLLGEKFVMELVSGVGYKKNYVIYWKDGQRKDYVDVWEEGFKPTMTFNIGFAF